MTAATQGVNVAEAWRKRLSRDRNEAGELSPSPFLAETPLRLWVAAHIPPPQENHMTIRDEFREAGEEYARRLEQRRDDDAAEKATAVGQHDANAAAFASAVSSALDDLTPAPTEHADLADLAEAIRNDAQQENNS